MSIRYVLAMLCLAGMTASAALAGSAAGTRPLTPEEIKAAFIGHTWSGTVSGNPGVMTPAEKKASIKLKRNPTGRFKVYYSPDGSIMSWTDRTDFSAAIDGTWRINGNELCSSLRAKRVWKVGNVRATVSSQWCYRIVEKNGTLLMAVSKAPAGRASEIGQYFRPSLSAGNSVLSLYKAASNK